MRALLTATLLLATACRAPAPAEETSVDPLLAVVRAQEAAWNTGSVEAFMAAGYWQSDGLTFLSPPLERETEITGPLAAKLTISSTTRDADLFLVPLLSIEEVEKAEE